MKKPAVFVLGANPAYQKTLHFSRFRDGNVNRADGMTVYAGGKGVNFCRAADIFGKAECTLFQFAGGHNGEMLKAELERENIRHFTIQTAAETRCCVTCLDSDGNMTEVIEPSHALTETEIAEFSDVLNEKIKCADIFAVSGSLPDGTSVALYEKAVSIACDASVPVVLDIVQGLDGILSLPGKIHVKVNREEFLKIFKTDDFPTAAKYAASQWRNVCFAVTDGPGTAFLFHQGRDFRYSVPKLTEIASPLGAGDTAAAVMASCLADGIPAEEAFRIGLAAASANCLTPRAGDFRKEDLERLLPLTRMEAFQF